MLSPENAGSIDKGYRVETLKYRLAMETHRRLERSPFIENALELDPSHLGARRENAIEYFRIGMLNHSLQELEDILCDHPKDTETIYWKERVDHEISKFPGGEYWGDY